MPTMINVSDCLSFYKKLKFGSLTGHFVWAWGQGWANFWRLVLVRIFGKSCARDFAMCFAQR